MTRSLTISLLLLLSVTIGAMADGFNEKGRTDLGHSLEALEKVFLLFTGLFAGSWEVLLAYVGFRIAFFDILKNLAKGDKWSYLGDSCWWDRFLKKHPVHGVVFGRVIFLVFGISVTIMYL